MKTEFKGFDLATAFDAERNAYMDRLTVDLTGCGFYYRAEVGCDALQVVDGLRELADRIEATHNKRSAQ